MDIDEALARALDGEAVMFAGAGCSVGALNIMDDKIPLGGQFARILAAAISLPDDTPLEDASEAYADEFGDGALIDQIQRLFTAKTVSDSHEQLGRVPWRRLYTTNYDNVLEEAYKANSRRLTPVTATDHPHVMPKQHTVCVHLNGYVDRLTTDNVRSEIKLTEASYLTASLEDSPWVTVLRQDIKYVKSVFFVGYSLYDLDVRRLLLDSPDLKEKCFFIMGESPDSVMVRRAQRFGTVVKETVEGFAQLLERKSRSYVPVSASDLPTLAVKEQEALVSGTRITDQAFVNLMLFGMTDRRMMFESMAADRRYLLERAATTRVLDSISAGKRVAVIHSDMGNGKALMLEGLRLRALERGYRVFEAKERSHEAAADLRKIARLPGKVMVTIDGYQDWLDEIQDFRVDATEGAVLVLTARTAIHDLWADDLVRVTGQDIAEFQLDAMSPEEIEWFLQAFNEYGLWGEWARQSWEQKIRFLRRSCGGQIHAILLKTLASPDINTRLRNLVDSLKRRTQEYQVFLSCCILALLNQPSDYVTLADLWGPEALSHSRFHRESVLRQFMDFTLNEVSMKSPVTAHYILTNVADASMTVFILTEMTKRAHTNAGVSPQYDSMLRNLMKFSNVQMMLPETGKAGAVITYYESIKNLYRCKESPLFWLQYAIACLAIGDLYRSNRYFDTAYSLAGKHWFDTFQIDNHYARYLLVEAVDKLELSDAMSSFRRARTIINRQVRDERLHYPYRVATQYQSFLDRFGSSMSQAQLEEVGEAAQYVKDMIDRLPSERRSHRYIRECYRAMDYIVERAHRS